MWKMFIRLRRIEWVKPRAGTRLIMQPRRKKDGKLSLPAVGGSWWTVRKARNKRCFEDK